jgi:hypothetical protein
LPFAIAFPWPIFGQYPPSRPHLPGPRLESVSALQRLRCFLNHCGTIFDDPAEALATVWLVALLDH